MDVWFPAHNEPLSWGFHVSRGDPLFVQPVPELLARTQSLHKVLGHHVPAEQAAFARGIDFASALTSGATGDEISEGASAIIRDFETALPADAFEDPVEIQGKRVYPRRLDVWALSWADAVMSRTAVPFQFQNSDTA